jgi:hypothetical protein
VAPARPMGEPATSAPVPAEPVKNTNSTK